ncbi:hypothetical protein BDF21DRAFT_497364 [Thamnidium elegans]|uniref:Uncharacterized protein n=1 Tax=Thamnidium elegans TaxID=101142 RepID=A0A8H7SSS5_9FUNG|nr:hypothetical protein INT48_003410 [Thamnidium elegans]KAI8059720.1 hypothetical protein BDF21DRAFT_497364 [Thamnidium elegans]
MVEDIVFKASEEFIVEHTPPFTPPVPPAHSFIFNTKDPVWKEAFSQFEFDKIEAAGNIFQFNKLFPPDLDIYDAVAAVEAHPTEQDLLDDVFGFIKTSYRLSGTKAYGAKQSQSSSECKNSTRSMGSSSQAQRKQSEENADLSFS